jgi:hypothetical protein
VVAVVVLLAGCAPAVPTQGHAPASPSSSASQAATPPAAAAPGSRVPLKCDDLFTTAAVGPLVGASVRSLRDDASPAANLLDLANAQLGTLGCEWGGGEAFESGYTADLSVFIAPDSAAEFSSRYRSNLSSSSPETVVSDTAGDKSAYQCQAQAEVPDGGVCQAEMLVGSYWVSSRVSTLAPASASSSGTSIQSALTQVAAKLRAAGAPKAGEWEPPTSRLPTFCTDPGSTALVRTIVGAPSLVLYPSVERTLDASRISLAGRDAECTWTSPTAGTISVELLVGGSWAFPNFAPVAPVDSIIQGPYLPTRIAGATSALLACADGACEGYLEIGTTVADVYTNAGLADSKTQLAGLAKAIAAS